MFCPNCGTQNPETSQTCSKCSFNLKGAAAPKFKGTMLMMNQQAAAAPGASGVSQITVFDATADSLPAAGFFADWGFTISTLTVTGGSPVWASKAQAPPQRRARIRIRRIGLRHRTRKYTPG